MKKQLTGLYAITPESSTPAQLLEAVEKALLGGANIVQYRDKTNTLKRRTQEAINLSILCKKYNKLFIVNDDIDLAIQSAAHGIHLGKNDIGIAAARNRLGGDAIIGISCYNLLNLAICAEERGANYVAFGAFYDSSVKPSAVSADIELLQTAKNNLSIPVVAIGGIRTNNANILVQQGADMVAVINGLFSQNNIESTAQQFAKMFSKR